MTARRWTAGLVLGFVVSAGCVSLAGISDGTTDAGASADAGGGEASFDAAPDVSSALDATPAFDAAPCPIYSGAIVCNAGIPMYTGSGSLAENGQDFCDIVAQQFVLANGLDSQGPGATPPTSVYALVRVAWSTSALYADIVVYEPSVNPPPSNDPIQSGDAVELFIAPPGARTGPFGSGGDNGAQIIMTPPGPDGTLSAVAEVFNAAAVTQFLVLKKPGQYNAWLVDGGYEAEVAFPWNLFQDAGVIETGAHIGFDLSIDVREDAGRFSTTLWYDTDSGARSVDAGADCPSPGGSPHPYCDDLTWCSPPLLQ